MAEIPWTKILNVLYIVISWLLQFLEFCWEIKNTQAEVRILKQRNVEENNMIAKQQWGNVRKPNCFQLYLGSRSSKLSSCKTGLMSEWWLPLPPQSVGTSPTGEIQVWWELEPRQSAVLTWTWKMFQMLLLFTVVLVVFVLKQTLFKRSKCRGNIPMAGKTVIITGERVWGGRDAWFHLKLTLGSSITPLEWCHGVKWLHSQERNEINGLVTSPLVTK